MLTNVLKKLLDKILALKTVGSTIPSEKPNKPHHEKQTSLL